MRGCPGRLVEIVALTAAASLWASPAAAQTSPSPARTIDVWTAASLGFAHLGPEGTANPRIPAPGNRGGTTASIGG